MKKTLNIIASAAVALAAITSCAKEQLIENVLPAGEAIQVSINGQIGELTPADATKATAGSVVRVTWEQGDKVYVYDGSDASIGTLTVTPDEKNTSYALLSGKIGSEASPSKLTLVYVKGETEAPDIAGGKISIDLSTQDQAEVPFVLYSTIDYDAAKLEKSKECIPFSFATSVMTVNCTGLPTDEGTKIDITKAEIDGVSTKCELTVTGSGVTVAGASKGTITRSETAKPSVFTQSDSRGSFILALAADPETPAARNILVYQGSKVYGAPFTSTTLAVNKSYNTVYELGEYVAPPAGILPGEFTVVDEGGNVKKVHFSRGNLYYDGSKFNFEANQYDSTPTTEGDWDANHVSHFFWSKTESVTYEASYSDESANENDVFFTNETETTAKESFKVNVDGKEQRGWRTLSKDEWYDLFYADDRMVNGKPCYSNAASGVSIESITYKGVFVYPDNYNGDIVSSSMTWNDINAAGIVFLPAAGIRIDSDEVQSFDYGTYWSSSPKNKYNAYYVVSDSEGVGTVVGNCYYGCSVRLVTEASDGYAPKAPEVPVESISLSETELELIEGGSKSLTVTFTPEGATKKDVFWSSDNTAVATVDQTGKVSAVSTGTATITAVADGLVKATCEVTVTKLPKYVIIYKAEDKLIESDPNDDETPGIHINAFGENAIKSHEFKDGVGTITFDNDVTSIGQQAFYGCGITYVGIPASVKEIGLGAFAECEALEQVYIADGSELETIGAMAFASSGLKSFNIPASVMSIENAFNECQNLTTVTFADNSSLNTIGTGAFYDCTKLTSVNIPASVTVICLNAFHACKDLTTVTFAKGSQLSTIGNNAFEGSGLTAINIPASVTDIGESSFYNCYSLTEVKVNWVDNIPSIKDKNVFGVSEGGVPSRTLYVPSGKVDMYNADNGWNCFGTITYGTE